MDGWMGGWFGPLAILGAGLDSSCLVGGGYVMTTRTGIRHQRRKDLGVFLGIMFAKAKEVVRREAQLKERFRYLRYVCQNGGGLFTVSPHEDFGMYETPGYVCIQNVRL